MKFHQDHEPELKDMDDFHKPLKKSKKRIIIVSFVALMIIFGVIQLSKAFFLN